MRIRKSLHGLLKGSALCLVMIGYAPYAAGLTFEEFETLKDHQKANFVSTVLHHFFFNYIDDPNQAFKADCMLDLDDDNVRDEDERLYNLVMGDLYSARVTTTEGASVENVIKAIIERTCAGR